MLYKNGIFWRSLMSAKKSQSSYHNENPHCYIRMDIFHAHWWAPKNLKVFYITNENFHCYIRMDFFYTHQWAPKLDWQMIKKVMDSMGYRKYNLWPFIKGNLQYLELPFIKVLWITFYKRLWVNPWNGMTGAHLLG